MNELNIPLSDPRVNGTEEAPRLNRQAITILDRLKQGKATNSELGEIASRFGARIHDLRKAGYSIEIVYRDRKSGLTVYELDLHSSLNRN